jgi:hypothetical protein
MLVLVDADVGFMQRVSGRLHQLGAALLLADLTCLIHPRDTIGLSC